LQPSVGAQQVGSQGAGAQQVGSQAAGAQQVGSQAAGAQQVGSQAAGAQQVGSQAAGAQQVGSEEQEEQPLLLPPNRPNRPAFALLEMVNTIIAAVKTIPFIVSLLLTQ